MKVKVFLAIAAFVLASVGVQAQQKIGYTNVDFVLSKMPEAKQIENDLKATQQQYTNMAQQKMKDYEGMVKEYETSEKSWSDVIKADKARTIQNKQDEIQKFQNDSQQALVKKQDQLLQPVMEKIQKAINEVAKENGYTYVFNSDAGRGTAAILLVAPEDGNVSNLVLKKLGVNPDAAPATPAPKK
jgi:outer membrane protein